MLRHWSPRFGGCGRLLCRVACGVRLNSHAPEPFTAWKLTDISIVLCAGLRGAAGKSGRAHALRRLTTGVKLHRRCTCAGHVT